MKIKIIRSNDDFCNILEYLHYHMDHSFLRELMYTDSNKCIPRYIISEQTFEYKNIKFTIIKQEEFKKEYSSFFKYSELILDHESFEYLNKFITECIIFITKNKYHCEKLYIYNSTHFNWNLDTELIKRDINNIYIIQKVKDDLLLDIKSFNEPKTIERYKQLDITHVRMYMFYGPPGTGKTSLIKSIATHFKKNIAYLTIKSDQDTSDLQRCIQNVPDNTIICLEDVDSLFGEDRKQKTAVTFSGFINCFDGLSTPENLIVFMTTNNLKSIEHAVIRRISYFIEFKYAVKEQIKQMFEKFFPDYSNDFDKFYANIGEIDITINILEKFFTKYLFDDIIKVSKNFSKFANGELKIELNNTNKLYT